MSRLRRVYLIKYISLNLHKSGINLIGRNGWGKTKGHLSVSEIAVIVYVRAHVSRGFSVLQ